MFAPVNRSLYLPFTFSWLCHCNQETAWSPVCICPLQVWCRSVQCQYCVTPSFEKLSLYILVCSKTLIYSYKCSSMIESSPWQHLTSPPPSSSLLSLFYLGVKRMEGGAGESAGVLHHVEYNNSHLTFVSALTLSCPAGPARVRSLQGPAYVRYLRYSRN